MQDTSTAEILIFALCTCCETSSWATVRVKNISPLWEECFIWLPPKGRSKIFIAFPSCPAIHSPTVPRRAGWCPQPVLLLPWAGLPLEAVKVKPGMVPSLPSISCIHWPSRLTSAMCLFSCPIPLWRCAHRCLLLFKKEKHSTFVCFANLQVFEVCVIKPLHWRRSTPGVRRNVVENDLGVTWGTSPLSVHR